MPVINIGINISGLQRGAASASSTLNGIARSASQAQKGIDTLTASLAGAAKQVLALVGAYKTLDSIKGFAERGVEFNSSMEQSQIAIGSMIASMAKLEDGQGNILKGAEKYAAAQGLAANMMKEIQRLGLETTATTASLVEGVQSVMGSALNAGLKLNQIPQFAVAAAQAMQTMKIPLEQMRTEIDALLTGNINKSQDLLAPRLELDKKTIESWKEQGVLFDKLMEKLAAYKQAGQDVANTWKGLTSNLQEAIDLISGQAATGLSESLKESVRNLQDLFITSKDGTTSISSDFENVAAVIERVQTALGEGILSAVNSFADGVRSLNDAIGDMGGAEGAIEEVKASTMALGAALASLAVVRNSNVRQAAQVISSEFQIARAVASGTAVLLGSAEARRQQALATMEAARADNAAAQAAVADAQAQLRSAEANMKRATTLLQVAQATRQQAMAQERLVQAQERAITTSATLAAAERRLAAATREAAAESARSSATAGAVSSIWGRAFTGIAAGATRVGKAFKALWAGLGGGVGVAIMAIVGGLAYLSSRQDNAAKATELHTKALNTYKAATEGATDETGKLTGKLTELQRAQIEISQRDAMKAYKLQLGEVVEILDTAVKKTENIKNSIVGSGVSIDEKLVPDDITETFDALTFLLKNGQISASDFREELITLRNVLKDSGHENSDFVKTIDTLIEREKGLANQLVETESSINLAKDALNKSGNDVKEALNTNKKYKDVLKSIDEAQNTEIKSSKEAVDWLMKRTAQTESMSEVLEHNNRLKDEAALKELELAEAMAQLTLASEISKLAMAENAEEASKAVDTAITNLQKIQQTRAQVEKGLSDLYAGRTKKKSGGSGGASQIESARQSLARLREEIDQLNGTAGREGGALQKKLADIEKMGKAAKMSTAEIQALKNEYATAFKADTFKDFEKAVLQIEGDSRKLREIEIAETMKEWGLRFADLGMSTEEAVPKLERLKEALQKQEGHKNLQVVADFYKDLAQRTGDFNTGLEYQNHLLQEQANAWLMAGIPMRDVEHMLELMRLEMSRAPWDGMVRGLNKFGAEATNTAAQLEGALTNAFDGASDALADFVMKGKADFNSLANSMIADLARIASRQAMGNIASGLGGLLGGMFGGGGGSSMMGNVPLYGGYAVARGGVLGGSGLSAYSGSIVSRPTLFSYETDGYGYNPPNRFARGAGLMGEAGPEAILPLTRIGGELGVRAELPEYSGSSAAPVAININPVVIDRTERGVSADVNQTRDSMGNLRFEVIIDEIDRRMAQRTQNRQSQTANAINKVNGLNSANSLYRG